MVRAFKQEFSESVDKMLSQTCMYKVMNWVVGFPDKFQVCWTLVTSVAQGKANSVAGLKMVMLQ